MNTENIAKPSSAFDEIFMKPSSLQRNPNENKAAPCNGACAPGTCLASL